MSPSSFFFLIGLIFLLGFSNRCCSLPVDSHQKPSSGGGDHIRDDGKGLSDHKKNPIWCDLCIVAVDAIQKLANSNKSFEEIYPLAVELCESLVEKAGNNGEYMCPGLISAYGVPVLAVVDAIVLDPNTVCHDLHICSNQSSIDLTKTTKYLFPHALSELIRKVSPQNFTLDSNCSSPNSQRRQSDTLLFGRYPSKVTSSNTRKNTQSRKPLQQPSRNDEITFLQIGDIHWDQLYAEGSPTDCCLYVCCRSWYNGTGSAGHYGAYGCDLPTPTLDLLIDSILNLDPAPQFIVYTGDNPPHDVWNETQSSQMYNTKSVVDYLAQRLPNFVIYPAIGNHESWPASEYTGQLEEYKALTRNLSTVWKKWVEFTPEAEATIARGGYYSLKVMDGLRIISFNTNYGYLYNFYSFLNFENEHYREQWEWLEKELSQASTQGEKVLLIGHIPPGHEDNWEEFGQLYLSLTWKYRNIIIGHLFGHTHKDNFELVQDAEGEYGVVLISPSVTPYPHINPSFRMFTMDASSKDLLEYTQYYLNLTEANELYTQGQEDKVKFEVSYNTKTDYKLADLSPSSWSQLAKNLESDAELLNSFYFNRFGKSYSEKRVCDSECKKKLLCEVNNIISSNAESCKLN